MAKDVLAKGNPQLKKRVLKDGRISLYLEYYLGRFQKPRLDESGREMFYESGIMAGKPMYVVKHLRQKEDLKLYLIAKPRTPEEREKNRQTQVLAEGIRAQTDIRNIKLAINRFKSFIREKHPECTIKKPVKEIEEINNAWTEKHKGVNGKHEINPNEHFNFYLKPGQLSDSIVADFVSYLEANSKGSGAGTAFARFRKMINRAQKEGIIKNNPCTNIKSPSNQTEFEKDVLSPEEIMKLVSTHYEGENPNIRRAFILSLYCGIRYCDVKDLRYSNIDYANSILSFEQVKTKGHSKHSRVSFPLLRADLLQIIGKPEDYGKSTNDLIFDLPSHTMCNKALSHWVKRAGIEKHITWHCGRHSFATNILTGGANIRVVADLLGHSGLQYVSIYTRAIDQAKALAVASLPEIKTL